MGVVVPLAQPRTRASACQNLLDHQVVLSAYRQGSSATRVLRCRINLSTVDVGPSARAAFPKFLADICKRLRLGARKQARDPLGRQPRAPHSTRGVRGRRSHDGAPWFYPRIADRGRRTSAVIEGVPDPAQPQLGERPALTELLEAAHELPARYPMSAPGARARSSLGKKG